MTTEFISVLDAVAKYDVSQNKIRKIVKDNKGTANVKKVAIKGKHGFKYLISVDYLNTLFEVETKPKQGKNEVTTDLEQSNQLVKLLQTTNKRLNNQIENQNKVIENLSNTIKDQNKVIVAQAMQVHQLTKTTEPPSDHHNDRATEPPQTKSEANKKPSVLYFVIFALLGLVIVLMWLISQ